MRHAQRQGSKRRRLSCCAWRCRVIRTRCAGCGGGCSKRATRTPPPPAPAEHRKRSTWVQEEMPPAPGVQRRCPLALLRRSSSASVPARYAGSARRALRNFGRWCGRYRQRPRATSACLPRWPGDMSCPNKSVHAAAHMLRSNSQVRSTERSHNLQLASLFTFSLVSLEACASSLHAAAVGMCAVAGRRRRLTRRASTRAGAGESAAPTARAPRARMDDGRASPPRGPMRRRRAARRQSAAGTATS
jgi:hypothetical protein